MNIVDEEMSESFQNTTHTIRAKLEQLDTVISDLEKGIDVCYQENRVLFTIILKLLTFLLIRLDMVTFNQLRKEANSLDKWMDEVQKFLTAEDVAWGDPDTIEAQLEQSNVRTFLTLFIATHIHRSIFLFMVEPKKGSSG